MNAIVRKSKAGVTLVELLVVILIVTILSVSLLPLLKPYIEESKYAAEPIPVIANLQTKINLYQYEKDKLPGYRVDGDADSTYYETWQKSDSNGKVVYNTASQNFGESAANSTNNFEHFSTAVDVDWQDLLGRRMNPSQFKYSIIKADGAAKYGYVLGVFGDGDGLGKGTGYAVMTLVDTTPEHQYKIVATWKRYKPKDDVQISFARAGSGEMDNNHCYIPTKAMAFSGNVSTLVTTLSTAGWDFNKEAIQATSSGSDTDTE